MLTFTTLAQVVADTDGWATWTAGAVAGCGSGEP